MQNFVGCFKVDHVNETRTSGNIKLTLLDCHTVLINFQADVSQDDIDNTRISNLYKSV